MFISGCMEYNLWMIQFKNHTYTLLDTNVTNDGDKIDIRIFLLKLQTDIMKGSFSRIKQD